MTDLDLDALAALAAENGRLGVPNMSIPAATVTALIQRLREAEAKVISLETFVREGTLPGLVRDLRARADAAEARVAHLEAGIDATIRKYLFASPVTFDLKRLLDGGRPSSDEYGKCDAPDHNLASLAVGWERKADEAERELAGLPVGRERDVQAMYVRTMRKRVGELRARLRRLT